MTERRLIVCDLETSSLGADAIVLEIAAVALDGEEFRVVPFLPPGSLAKADPMALSINRYYERKVWADQLEDADGNNNAYSWLYAMLQGNVFAGSNPAFDAPKIAKLIGGEPWHYRLADVSAYAAGVLGIPPTELPGLNKVCELLGVVNDDPHSALGDARATAECFRRLMDMK